MASSYLNFLNPSRTPTQQAPFTPNIIYTLFFLTIEPISALVGAYFAHFRPGYYLESTSNPYASSDPFAATTNPTNIPTGTLTILSQLSNLYLLFAINECLVLRSTHGTNLRVWRTLLFGLLVADLGHLWSVKHLLADGFEGVYWRFWEWNAMYWGNLGFVYAGASMRVAFLMGIGIETESGRGGAKGVRSGDAGGGRNVGKVTRGGKKNH